MGKESGVANQESSPPPARCCAVWWCPPPCPPWWRASPICWDPSTDPPGWWEWIRNMSRSRKKGKSWGRNRMISRSMSRNMNRSRSKKGSMIRSRRGSRSTPPGLPRLAWPPPPCGRKWEASSEGSVGAGRRKEPWGASWKDAGAGAGAGTSEIFSFFNQSFDYGNADFFQTQLWFVCRKTNIYAIYSFEISLREFKGFPRL